MLNVAFSLLPPDVDKIAWLDCDIVFENRSWARDAARLLADHAVVQLFESVRFLAPDGGPDPWHSGKQSLTGFIAGGSTSTGQLHPGFAWASGRSLLEKHGLPDFLIAGSADAIIALSAVDKLSDIHLARYSPPTRQRVECWSRSFSADVGGKVGFVPGTIRHLWHGLHRNRRYLERLQALARMGFDPQRHLETGPDQLYQWTESTPARLPEVIEAYLRERQEDETAAFPLPVTAVMVTGETSDRVPLARRAAWSFARQNYVHKHLLILNACPTRVLTQALLRKMREVCDTRNVKEVSMRAHPAPVFGQLLDHGVALAKTNVVARWDDDCISHPQRLAMQMAAWSGATAVVLRRAIQRNSGRTIAIDADHLVGSGIPGSVLWDKRIQTAHRLLRDRESTAFIEQLVELVPVIAVNESPTLYVHDWYDGHMLDDDASPGHQRAIIGPGATSEERDIVESLLSDALTVELSESA